MVTGRNYDASIEEAVRMPIPLSDDYPSRKGIPQSVAMITSAIPIEPRWDERYAISLGSNADIDQCWTCGSCDNGCPVSTATGRLRPQQTVRMAVYGMTDRLLELPDIWYCLSCRRCLQGCPNRVRPFDLHRYLRTEAIRRGIIAVDFLDGYQRLFSEFQRVRWRAAAHCFNDRLDRLADQTWYQWLKRPLRQPVYRPIAFGLNRKPNRPSAADGRLAAEACLTCSECSGCCPIYCDGNVFDPQRIIRMANLGLCDDLLRSPAIWLCLGCRRCQDACSQRVSGWEIIGWLQQQTIEKGLIDPGFPLRLREADRIIYPKFLDEIDVLIGLHRRHP